MPPWTKPKIRDFRQLLHVLPTICNPFMAFANYYLSEYVHILVLKPVPERLA